MTNPSDSAESAFKTHPRIFIVDDEPEIAKMMSVILQMNLFDAVPFSDPTEVLGAARTQPPDYLISDVQMQGMNGIELALAIRKELPECKVLLFSGQPDAREMIENATKGGETFAFLQKPVHPTELVAAINSL